jgi:glycosyltransferase involved in cell wall biosynthesis
MEAMSAGIPAVAPDVGGVSTLVSTDCGYLLKPDPSGLDIADGISAVYFNPEVDRMRIAAKERIARKFNAKINYPSIIHAICGQNCVSLDDSAPSAHLSITEAGGRD